MLLNSNSENTRMQARKDQNRYRRRTKGLSKKEGQRLKKQCEDDEALKAIQEVYPQCADCLYHFKSQRVLGKHICSGRMESRDALTNAMKHANKLLVSMDFTVDGAIAQASPYLRQDTHSLNLTFMPDGLTPGKVCIQTSLLG